MKYINYIMLIAGMGLILSSCGDKEPRFELNDAERAFDFRVFRDVTSFNILDAAPSVSLTVYSSSENISHVDIMADVLVFNLADPVNSPLTPRGLIQTVNKGEFDNAGNLVINLTLQGIVDAIGFPIDSLKGGDIVNIYSVVTLDDGRIFPDTLTLNEQAYLNLGNAFYTTTTTSFNSLLPFAISCPSDLETTTQYDVTTLVENTCCGLPTGTFNGVRPATVSKTGTNTYLISDFLADYFAVFNGPADEPVIVTDVCNIIQVDASADACPVSSFLCYIPNSTDGFGSYDPDTDTWIIKWEDAFGNNIRGVTTLTPQ